MSSRPADQASSSSGLSTRDLFAGISGNVMEWYDFAVYGYFAGLIGSLFFPSKDPTVAAFGVFAGGYLMRPLGGLVFGHIGDRLGRRRALTVSSLLMGVPTALIGFMPMLVQAFPREVRCSAVSTSYNVVLGIFGGTAPIVATYLIQRTHDDLSPAYFIMVAACISAVALFTMRRRIVE
jgi:MFS family permease